MAEQWLIDGYNLLRALQSSQSKKNHLTREQLFELAAQFASFTKSGVLMVLDGVGSNDELQAHNTENFHVVFSQKISADTYIEQYLYQERGKLSMIVVTDDRAITHIARGGGAQVLGTALFAENLEQCRKHRSEILNKEESRGHGFHRPFEDKLKDL